MFIDQFQLAAQAQLGLNKLRNNKQQEITESENSFNYTKADYARMSFEEYDESVFDTKSTLDSYYFKRLIKNIPEENLNESIQIISNLYDTVKQIYEHVNIKPKTYGFNISNSLNGSEEKLEEQAQNYINNFLKDNYYNLTAQQRQEKYFPKIKPIAESLVIENQLDENQALEFASKVVLMEDLINRICFPLTAQAFIEESLHDASYAQIFEQDALQELWDSFHKQSHNFAKVVSMLV